MKTKKASHQMRHAPLASEIEKPVGKLKPSKQVDCKTSLVDSDEEEINELNANISMKITKQANRQRNENNQARDGMSAKDNNNHFYSDDDNDFDDEEDDDNYSDSDSIQIDDGLVHKDGDYIDGLSVSNAEEAVVQKFLNAGNSESRSLADIIMAKLRERETSESENVAMEEIADTNIDIPAKVVEVYTSVGKMLAHYKSGKLPKALKMLPHLKNWEHILWLTRPDEWSPSATYAATRVFASNLNAKMAQRFFNLVLLEKCRDDIRVNNKMNYHLYLALKKALFKPAAFYKGLLLPLAQSGTCTLREALIIGSVLSKVSIPGNHSAAVILRLAEMPYSGSTSLFIKVLLNKKYALPRRVIEALVVHFCSFSEETRVLPVRSAITQ